MGTGAGGLYGRYPSLTDLDERGDLKYTLIFGMCMLRWRSIGGAGQQDSGSLC
ncbi:MAG: hypothetical protein R3E89_13890 [Thiolinea sp.]